MKRWCGPLVALGLVACSPGKATPTSTGALPTTSVEIAAPTTVTSTTATPSTTLAATTTSTSVAPTTTVALAPAEQAEVEIGATLDALNNEIWACFASPTGCQVDALLDKYFAAGDDVVRPIFHDVWQARIDNDQVKIVDGRISRRTVWIRSDEGGQTGSSFHCEVDETFNVPTDTPPGANTTVPVDLEPGYLRFYYEWEKQPDGPWIIVHSEFGGGRGTEEIETGALPSLTESEVAECV